MMDIENQKDGTYVLVFLHRFILSDEECFSISEDEDVISVAEKVMDKYHEKAFAFRRFKVFHGNKRYIDPGFMYLTGNVETRDEVYARNDPSEDILRRNMEYNDYRAMIRIGPHAMPFDPKKDVNLEIDKEDVVCGRFF